MILIVLIAFIPLGIFIPFLYFMYGLEGPAGGMAGLFFVSIYTPIHIVITLIVAAVATIYTVFNLPCGDKILKGFLCFLAVAGFGLVSPLPLGRWATCQLKSTAPEVSTSQVVGTWWLTPESIFEIREDSNIDTAKLEDCFITLNRDGTFNARSLIAQPVGKDLPLDILDRGNEFGKWSYGDQIKYQWVLANFSGKWGPPYVDPKSGEVMSKIALSVDGLQPSIYRFISRPGCVLVMFYLGDDSGLILRFEREKR